MKRYQKLAFGLIIFMLLANYSGWFRLLVINFWPDKHITYFRYTTRHRDFSSEEEFGWKGRRSYAQVADLLDNYRRCQPTSPDTVLYRTFRKEPGEFYNWLAFLTHPRYRLPYIDSELVKDPPDRLYPTVCPDRYPERSVLTH